MTFSSGLAHGPGPAALIQLSGAGRSTTNRAIHLVPIVCLGDGAIHDEFMRIDQAAVYSNLCGGLRDPNRIGLGRCILFPGRCISFLGAVVPNIITGIAKPGALREIRIAFVIFEIKSDLMLPQDSN